MGPIDALNHFVNFFAPALFVAGALWGVARLLPRKAGKKKAPRAWLPFVVNAAVGSAALVAGLLLFGRDGKMASYGLLVVCCALSQWLVSGEWKR
ncbi:MAG TPA: hypothetical protein VGE70_01585 [Burkholderiaceae bacterium]